MSDGRVASWRRNRVLRAVVGLAVPVAVVFALVAVLRADAYLWVKALHIVAAAGWVVGMVGLLALYVCHGKVRTGAVERPTVELLGDLERGLLLRVVNPVMMITWALGGWLVWTGEWWRSGWFHGKLTIVMLLSAVHGYVSAEGRRLGADRPRGSARFYLVLNAVTAALAIGAVILAVVKPL